jgi:LPS export ABC transporter protein LptC
MTADNRFPARWGAVLTAGALVLAAAGCNGLPKANPMSSRGDMPDQEVTDFVLTETDAGRPEWTLYARWAATYTARNVVVARDIRVDFFDEKGARSSELTAREGEIQQLTRDMTARGDVVLTTTEGTRMNTEEMRFSNQQQLISSDKLVRIERPGETLEAVGFSGDPDLKHFEFRSQVNATVRSRSGALIEKGGSHK